MRACIIISTLSEHVLKSQRMYLTLRDTFQICVKLKLNFGKIYFSLQKYYNKFTNNKFNEKNSYYVRPISIKLS